MTQPLFNHWKKEPVLVSLCWTGEPCRFHGRPVPSPKKIARIAEQYELHFICPEQLAGLPTPRPAAPLRNLRAGRLYDENGLDVTESFQVGARRALAIAESLNVRLAFLCRNSPSCDINGFTGSLFKEHGIKVINL
jgi:uncharacterized protein YbbK (DUF523 family)